MRWREASQDSASPAPLSLNVLRNWLCLCGKGRRLAHSECSFAAAEQGSVVIEFAFLGVLFIVILATILQVLLMDWQAKNLDEALQRAARLVYTGRFQNGAQASSDPASRISELKNELCSSDNTPIFNCADAKINISVKSSFASGSIPKIVDSRTRGWSSEFGSGYACGAPGAIVVLTAAVRQPVVFRFLSFGTSPFADGSHLMQSTVVFRTEPYGDTSSRGAC